MTIEHTASIADARQDFERVSQVMQTGGAREAYEVLKEESERTQNLSAGERNAWQREMTSQLTQAHDGNAPILPRLSIAFLEDNQRDFTGLFGQRITGWRIAEQREQDASALLGEQFDSENSDLVNNVDAALLNGLSHVQDDTIRNAVNRHQDFGVGRLDQFLQSDQEDATSCSVEQADDRSISSNFNNDGRIFNVFEFGSDLAEATRVQRGDGYWHVASRLVDLVGGDASNARIAQLTQALQAANGDAMLHPNQNLFDLLENQEIRSLL